MMRRRLFQISLALSVVAFLSADFQRSTAKPTFLANASGDVAGVTRLYAAHGPAPQGLGSLLWTDHYVDAQPTYTTECWRIQFRPWLVMIPPALLPACWAANTLRRRHRTTHPGLCRHCGYDLRAAPDRCPECGRSVNL